MCGKVGRVDLDPAVWSLRPSAEKVTMGFGREHLGCHRVGKESGKGQSETAEGSSSKEGDPAWPPREQHRDWHSLPTPLRAVHGQLSACSCIYTCTCACSCIYTCTWMELWGGAEGLHHCWPSGDVISLNAGLGTWCCSPGRPKAGWLQPVTLPGVSSWLP